MKHFYKELLNPDTQHEINYFVHVSMVAMLYSLNYIGHSLFLASLAGLTVGAFAVYWLQETRQQFKVRKAITQPKGHYEQITCPVCQKEQLALVAHTFPWYSYIHECTSCHTIIQESEWDTQLNNNAVANG